MSAGDRVTSEVIILARMKVAQYHRTPKGGRSLTVPFSRLRFGVRRCSGALEIVEL
jgi:hypothetical protein